MPYVYIAAQAEALDINKTNASYLIATIGAANTVGRIILGYISDKPWVNRLHVYNMCLTVCGIATCLSALCVEFWGLATYATVFGFTIGAYVGLTSVILVDLLGLENLTNAFGLLLLFQGIASFVGPPIGGEFEIQTLNIQKLIFVNFQELYTTTLENTSPPSSLLASPLLSAALFCTLFRPCSDTWGKKKLEKREI